MIYKSVFISEKRYATILLNFINKNRVKKSNYKFDIYQDEKNNYFLTHQYDMPQFKLITKDIRIRLILNKENELNIFYSSSARKKISQNFDIIIQ